MTDAAVVSIPQEVIDEYLQGLADKYIKILISGKTGSGKSTLCNALLGVKEGDTQRSSEHSSILEGGTKEVTKYEECVNGVHVTIWDCPGLQDGSLNQDNYLQQMEEPYRTKDLIIYCIKCGGTTRLVKTSEDVTAMKKLTEKFGSNFWKNTVILLTCANTLGAFRPEWKALSPNEVQSEFKSIIQEWKEQIQHLLINEVHVPAELVNEITIIPAGHYSEQNLPGIDYWLTMVWIKCLQAISCSRAQASFITMSVNNSRINWNLVLASSIAAGTLSGVASSSIVIVKAGIVFTGTVSAGALVAGAAVGVGVGVLAYYALCRWHDRTNE